MDNTTNTTPVTLESIAQKKSHAATRNTTPERNHDWAYTRNFCSAGTSYQQGKCHDESIQHGYGCFLTV